MSGEVHDWPAPPQIEDAREISKSSDAEVEALVNRGPPLPPAPGRRWTRTQWAFPIGGAALLAALLLWIFIPFSTPLKTGDLVTLDPKVVQTLGPDIQFVGDGALHVESTGPTGHDLRLLQGRATFAVDPEGANRNLTVHAGDTAVRVTGTVFGVSYRHERVKVWVDRGSVEVTTPDEQTRVSSGESWPKKYTAPTPAAKPVEKATAALKPKPKPKKRDPRFVDTPDSEKAFQAIDRAYAIDGVGPNLFDRLNAFLADHPKSRHRETVLLYQIELSEETESAQWRLKKVHAFLKRYPKSVHRRGLQSLKENLEQEVNE